MDWIIVAILILIFLYTFIPEREPDSSNTSQQTEHRTKDP